MAAGYLLASFAPGFWSLALLFALAGCGDAAWHPLATTILVQNAPSRRAQALGIHALGGTLSAVVGPVIVGFLLAQMDWRGALQLIIIPALLMGLAFFRISSRVPKQKSGRSLPVIGFRELLRIWTSRDGMNIIALISIYHMALIALLSMIPLYLQEFHGLSSSQTGVAYAAMLLAGAVAQPIVGRLSDLAGRRRVIVLGNGIAALAAFSVGWFEDAGSIAGVLVVLLAGVAVLECIRSSMLAVAVEHSQSREGLTLGFAFSLMDGFGALGALFAGWAAGIQFSHAFLLSSVFASIAVILGLNVSFRRSQSGSSMVPETP